MPAIQAAQAAGIDASGPHPADTVFHQAVHRKRYDAIVCMYHDQGHTPMKLLAFESGVNITIGLPIVRTSVDHGTAFDIAWQGVAFTESLAARPALGAPAGQRLSTRPGSDQAAQRGVQVVAGGQLDPDVDHVAAGCRRRRPG